MSISSSFMLMSSWTVMMSVHRVVFVGVVVFVIMIVVVVVVVRLGTLTPAHELPRRWLAHRLVQHAAPLVAGLRMKRDVRSDPRQHVVTREHELVARLPEAQVPGGVAGCPNGREIPSRNLRPFAVFEKDVGLHRIDERAQGHGGLLE